MVKLTRILSMLDEQRRELLDQLAAIDAAIAALENAGTGAGGPAGSAVAERPRAGLGVRADTAVSAVVPKRVKPKRVLSDAHKQALVIGKRKAREAKDAAKGLAREMPDDSFVPAIGTPGENQAPRLVKRPIKN
jgi:hypothetical protein